MRDSYPTEVPTFAELAADPEIAALLDFVPVPRKRVVDGAWTPELQREFIVRLAVTGSVGRSSEEMGKTDTGVRKLYRSPEGASFRAAWHGAVELARRRHAERAGAAEPVPPGTRPPSLDHRVKHGRYARSRPGFGAEEARNVARPMPDNASPLGDPLLETIMRNYFVKLAAERRARLAGDVVADFYLRQLTWIEVSMDIASSGGAIEAFRQLRLRSPGGGWDCAPVDVAETAGSRFLDQARRIYWANAGDPDRPPAAPDELFEEHEMIAPDGRQLTIYTQSSAIRGAPGLDLAAERRKQEEQQRRFAEEQISWEQKARADWEARQAIPSPPSGGEGAGDGVQQRSTS